MDLRLLEAAGLTNTEAKVYTTILELGSCLAGRISQKSGIHRRSVYDAIERLIEKGLVSYILTNNRKYFEAVEPKRLLDLVKEKQQDIQEILPELQIRFDMAKEKKETSFFKGKQALKSICEDQLKEGKEILIYGATPSAVGILKYYFPRFDKQRIKKNIKVKLIFDETARKNKDYIKNIPLASIRYLPEKYMSPAATNVYGNKVAIVVWKEVPIAILINDKDIADGYRKYFDILWDTAKE